MASNVHPNDYKQVQSLTSKLKREFHISFVAAHGGLLMFLCAAIMLAWVKMGIRSLISVASVLFAAALVFCWFVIQSYRGKKELFLEINDTAYSEKSRFVDGDK